MELYTCIDGSRKKINAYAADFWGRMQLIYDVADKECKLDVKKEIVSTLERLVSLIEREK